MESPFLTKQEVAKFLRVQEKTIDDYRAKGMINAVQIGRKILFHKDEINNYLRKAYKPKQNS